MKKNKGTLNHPISHFSQAKPKNYNLYHTLEESYRQAIANEEFAKALEIAYEITDEFYSAGYILQAEVFYTQALQIENKTDKNKKALIRTAIVAFKLAIYFIPKSIAILNYTEQEISEKTLDQFALLCGKAVVFNDEDSQLVKTAYLQRLEELNAANPTPLPAQQICMGKGSS